MQVAVVCEVMEADQQCEPEALSNWPGTHPKLRVFVTLGGACCVASWPCAKTGEDCS